MPLVHSRPVTGLQGKFSAEYTALAALKDGYIKLSSFENDRVLLSDIQRMIPLVKVTEMEGTTQTSQEIEDLPVRVTLKTTDRKVFDKLVSNAPGSKATPLSEHEYRNKWLDCIAHYAKLLKKF